MNERKKEIDVVTSCDSLVTLHCFLFGVALVLFSPLSRELLFLCLYSGCHCFLPTFQLTDQTSVCLSVAIAPLIF